jgi:hypothetical protein
VVATFAAVMQRLIGAAGTLLTVIAIILFGKPSEGGSGGVPYLPDFWTAIGLYLPPRNAYVLLRKAVYFDGHGTARALLILLAYLVVFGAILGLLDNYHRRAPELPVNPRDAGGSCLSGGSRGRGSFLMRGRRSASADLDDSRRCGRPKKPTAYQSRIVHCG